MRLLTKEMRSADLTVDLITEIMGFKGVEAAIESLPGTVVQFSALISGSAGGDPVVKLISLLLSSALVVMTTTSLDVRKDSDSQRRRDFGHFYGLIHSSGWKRTVVTSAIKTMATSQFLMTLMKLVLMQQAGKEGI